MKLTAIRSPSAGVHTRRCSFCGKLAGEYRRFFTNGGVAICDHCLALVEQVDNAPAFPPSPPAEGSVCSYCSKPQSATLHLIAGPGVFICNVCSMKFRAVENFFARYEEGANSFDVDLVCSQYTAEFLAADPNGVACGRNDEKLRAAVVQREQFFREIGFKRAKVLGLEATPLDDKYTTARVHWQMIFEKQSGVPLDFRFFITYFLFDAGTGPKAAFWISHEDERKVMQQAGLIP